MSRTERDDEPSAHWLLHDRKIEEDARQRAVEHARRRMEAAEIDAELARPPSFRERALRVWWDEVKRRDEANRVAWADGESRPFPGAQLTDHLA